ncbi:MAG: hypothetical protein A4C66_10585 [Nitrospira sp. HN-bin3]|uniref:hypothetical protein n=1 Tax=Nitrospira cf. moscoviensis SBR1015 TaxID=96242 RepID=UPI000A0EBC2F|nr:hypothetical protein [Nitrospira cf. moscoviensis SBR1015]OQW40696.1 MAG: hypothetical protein A4C66_10585 [Nitrospira sp. HN-bin3]
MKASDWFLKLVLILIFGPIILGVVSEWLRTAVKTLFQAILRASIEAIEAVLPVLLFVVLLVLAVGVATGLWTVLVWRYRTPGRRSDPPAPPHGAHLEEFRVRRPRGGWDE